MVANPSRRTHLADAGLLVLAADGARGLTHRQVDRIAEVPAGTTSNYFRTRDALLAALADRIFERLQPTAERLAQLATLTPDVEAYADHMDDVVARVTREPGLWLALLELRLEATRRPGLHESLGRTLAAGYAADLTYHRGSGLPGGDESVALLHHAIDGLLLDVLTPSIAPGRDTASTVRTLVRRLVG